MDSVACRVRWAGILAILALTAAVALAVGTRRLSRGDSVGH